MFIEVNFSLIFQLGVGKNSGSYGASPTRYQVCNSVCVCEPFLNLVLTVRFQRI